MEMRGIETDVCDIDAFSMYARWSLRFISEVNI